MFPKPKTTVLRTRSLETRRNMTSRHHNRFIPHVTTREVTSREVTSPRENHVRWRQDERAEQRTPMVHVTTPQRHSDTYPRDGYVSAFQQVRNHVTSPMQRNHVTSPPPRNRTFSPPPRSNTFSPPPRSNTFSPPPRNHVFSPPLPSNSRYPQSPLARPAVFTFESRDNPATSRDNAATSRERPRDLELWPRSEPTTPVLTSPPPEVMTPQRDRAFLYNKTPLILNRATSSGTVANHRPLGRSRTLNSVNNSNNNNNNRSRLNPMAPVYRPNVTSSGRAISPSPAQFHSSLRRNTLDAPDNLQDFERVRSATPNPVLQDVFLQSNSHSDPQLHVATTEPYTTYSHLRSPTSPYRAQKSSFESGYSSSSSSSGSRGPGQYSSSGPITGQCSGHVRSRDGGSRAATPTSICEEGDLPVSIVILIIIDLRSRQWLTFL